MRTSFLIAAHNEGESLGKTIRSCVEAANGLEYEIIVADDASTDDSVEKVRRRFPQVRFVSSSDRRGASPTKHLAAQNAQGDVLVFLDGHTHPEGSALLRLVEDVEALEGNAIVTPAVPHLDPIRWLNSRAQVGHGYTFRLDTLECGWVPLNRMTPRDVGRRRLYETPALIGCALAIGRGLYQELWGFDPAMRSWGVEDIDFGLKAWLLGYPILHDPQIVVGHRFRQAFDNYDVPPADLLANQLRFARKHFTSAVWSQWVEACRQRNQGPLSGHPEGLWARAWSVFEASRESVEQERQHLHSRRTRDEFEYAATYGLDWPRLAVDRGESSPSASASVEQPAEAVQLLQVQPSPSPSPPPPDDDDQATVKVELDYGDRTIVNDSNLVELTNDGHATYQASIPFKVTAHVPLSAGGSKTLRIYWFVHDSENATQYGNDIEVEAGATVTYPVSVGPPTAVGDLVGVKAGLYEPSESDPFVQAEKDEEGSGVDFDFFGIPGSLPFIEDTVRGFATQGSEQAVSQFRHKVFTTEFIDQTALSYWQEDQSRTVDQYKDMINANLDTAEEELTKRLNTVLSESVEVLIDSTIPKVTAKIGVDDPAKPGADEFAAGMKSAAANAFSDIAPEGLTLENAGEFFDFEIAGPDEFLAYATEKQLADKFKPFLRSGNVQLIPWEDLEDFVVLKRAAFVIPLRYGQSEGLFDASVSIVGEGFKWDELPDFSLEGSLKTPNPVQFGNVSADIQATVKVQEGGGSEAGVMIILDY